MIPTDDLFLDPINPRLTDSDFSINDQDRILKRLWTEFNVSEIVDSIVASNAFWRHEPLVAARESGKLVVVEGNRRLAAVKLLLSPEKQQVVGATGIPTINKQLEEDLQHLPVIERTRQQVWDFIGYKHVKGPQEWDSIAKADYIARIHEEYGIDLNDIAKAIGDRNATVRRLYHGLKVLQQAQDAGVFDPKDRFYQRKDFAYSHLWTGLGYEGIRDFLGLKNGDRDERKPVPRKNIPELGELCLWLYGSHSNDVEPLVKTQNPHLRQLDEALRAPRGIAALRRGLPLHLAVNAARGDTRLLLDALVSAEQNLREAKGYFSTGYKGQQEIADTISNIHSIADSLQKELVAVGHKKK
jgi:ParB-like chromosome segregation protein Spo0J